MGKGIRMNLITRTEAKELGLTRYFTGEPCKNGHIEERKVYNKNCIRCERLYPSYLKAKRRGTNKWKAGSPRWQLGSALRSGLKRRPTDNPITINELDELWNLQDGRCALTGELMTWKGGGKGPTPSSVSLDRIDSTGSYTKGNVRLICFWVNSARMNMTDDEFLERVMGLVNFQSGLRKQAAD
jgi:hypothetical protein